MAKRKSLTEMVGSIANREEFDGSSVSGRQVGDGDNLIGRTGRMGRDLVEQMRSESPNYVVHSYGTPIAWHGNKGWTMPDTKYSVTTSKHQSYVRRAISDHFVTGHDGARQ